MVGFTKAVNASGDGRVNWKCVLNDDIRWTKSGGYGVSGPVGRSEMRQDSVGKWRSGC